MIKTRQKNIRIFELSEGSLPEYIEFFKKNFPLFKGYLLVFKNEINAELVCLLQELKIPYIVNTGDFYGKETGDREFLTSQSKANTKIHMQNIRSGEEIYAEGDLVVLGNIHNGARVVAEGNISIFGTCDGILTSRGEYIILRSVNSGHIVFCEEILSEKFVTIINSNNVLKIITKIGDNIFIKEIQ